MRKDAKKILAMALSAAVVLSSATGISLTGSQKATAESTADAEKTVAEATTAAATVAPTSEAAVSPSSDNDKVGDVSIDRPFKIAVCGSNSKIFDLSTVWMSEKDKDAWKEVVAKDPNAFDGIVQNSTKEISKVGEYSFTLTADGDVDSLADEASAVWLATNLDPAYSPEFTIKGAKITVESPNGTKKEYKWDVNLVHEGLKAKGQWRLPVVNTYVTKAGEEKDVMNPLLKNVNGTYVPYDDGEVAIYTDDKVTFTINVTSDKAPATPTPVPTAAPTAPPAQKAYNAYMAFQMEGNYNFRNSWDDPEYGLNGVTAKDGKVTFSTKDLFKTAVGYWDKDESGNKTLGKQPATFKDVKMEDNGTFTVSMTGVNLKTLTAKNDKDAKLSKYFNMLYISTDIPYAMKGVTATGTVKIDGTAVATNVALPANAEASQNGGYYQFFVSDTYSETHETGKCAFPSTKELSVIPTNSIEITYTIKGINFDYKEIGLAKGKTFTKGNFKYKVTAVASESKGVTKAGTVKVVGLSKKGKKAKKLTVAKTVKNSVASYSITALGGSAFKAAKATSIIIKSKKIKKLPSKVFMNCKKLKNLKFAAKLTSINKKAFKGCKKKIKISGTSAKKNLKKIKKVYKKAK